MQNSTKIIFFIFAVFSPLWGMAQPTVDGDLSDSDYISLATKENANDGFGANIDVTEIVYYSDAVNSKLYVGVKGKLDTSGDNGIGLFLNFSGLTGTAAGNNLGFDGAGHYMDGQGSGSNQAFKADFEVDYMFAMNPGGGTTSVFLDAAKKTGGNATDFIGTATQSGGTATDADVFGTGGAATFTFNNGGGVNQGFEIVFDYSALGIDGSMDVEAFAFVVSATGFFSNVTVPGDVSGTNLGFNPDFNVIAGGPYHSSVAPLPVVLGDFNAVLDKQNNSVTLNWLTFSEENNAYFEIEKSLDGRTFAVIGMVNGAINSFDQTDYDFIDQQPYEGMNYYRLKQVDLDGDFTYSSTLTVAIEHTKAQLFPNPVQRFLTIKMETTANTVLEVYNLQGQLMQTSWLNDETTQEVELSALQAGVYLVRLSDERGNQLLSQSIIKQ